MSTLQDIQEENRRVSAALVTALGYKPEDVLDHRGDGSLERRGPFVILHLIVRDAAGEPVISGDTVRTRTRRVRVTREAARAAEVAR